MSMHDLTVLQGLTLLFLWFVGFAAGFLGGLTVGRLRRDEAFARENGLDWKEYADQMEAERQYMDRIESSPPLYRGVMTPGDVTCQPVASRLATDQE